MARKTNFGIRSLAPLACLAFCASGFGQAQPPANGRPAPFPPQQQVQNPAHAQPSQPAPTAKTPPAAVSLLDHPPQPAKITLTSGKLTIDADNSTLSEILRQVSEAGGMKVDGLDAGGNAGQRIFGSYGPGAPRDVLSELLDGAGYNVLMLGETPSGAPRELTLSARTGGGVPNPTPQLRNQERDEDDDDAIQPTQYPQDEHPNAPPVPAGVQNGVRTPEQIMQEMQRMREAQAQQPEQQQNQPN